MLAHARAILWAQLRTLRNFYPRGNRARMLITLVLNLSWYGMWLMGAIFVAVLLADTEDREKLLLLISRGLIIAFLYWQVVPVLLLSSGASLDLRRLVAYPIPNRQLFFLEVLLRLSTGVEMLLLLGGATVGLLANKTLPIWSPIGLLPFALMNLLLSAGLKNLVARLLARRYVKEFAIMLIVLAATLPSLLLLSGLPGPVQKLASLEPHPALPFSAAARIVTGQATPGPWLALAGWTVAAYCFGRWQFMRSLRFDADEAASPKKRVSRTRWADRLFQWPSVVFRDPLAALIEKELRFLSRAPRFRMLFVMGFTFGLLIWLPLTLTVDSGSALAANYLTFVSSYALLLVAEATFWNSFGFDRAAAQIYFLVPADVALVLRAKNIAAAVFVALEVFLIALVCVVLRMPITLVKLVEAFGVVCVLTLLVVSVGNLASAHFPRAVDPKQSWRNSAAGRFQAMLLLIYPVIAFPVGLAYLARYAFATDLAFYAVLAFGFAFGAVLYWVALGSAVNTIRRRQETLLAELAQRPGPVAS